MLILPVEAKPLHVDKSALLALPQGVRYARSFGGGYVLLTNLWTFIWAELDQNSGSLVERDSVALIIDPADVQKPRPSPAPRSIDRLARLLEAATSTRSIIADPDQVARLLAYHAQLMAESIRKADEEPQDLLAPLAKSMREGLGMHLEDEFFVPTVAQTFVYGLFAAWLTPPARRSSTGAGLNMLCVHALWRSCFIRSANRPLSGNAISRSIWTEPLASSGG